MYIFWAIVASVATFIAGFHYGRIIGIDAMLYLGAKVYPDFKSKVTKFVMEEDKKK